MDESSLCASCFSERGAGSTCARCGWGDQAEKPLVDGQLELGSVLRDRYVIGRPLGRGGFSITYLAWDSMLERRRAIKEYFPSGVVTRDGSHSRISILPGQTEMYSDGIQKYLSEARLLARFEGHPCIVYPLDFFEANQTAYLVMEYLEGETLRSYVMRQGGRIPYAHALHFLTPVIRALAAVHHAGILHRDVSPDNVFLTIHNESKLLDFGAARPRRGSRSPAMTVILREHYAPPEQYTSSGQQGYWTDIYAFAATFYFSITGGSPPSALDRVLEDRLRRPSEDGVAIPPAAEDILIQSLSVQPRERPQWIEDLLPALAGAPARLTAAEPMREAADPPAPSEWPLPQEAENHGEYGSESRPGGPGRASSVLAAAVGAGRAARQALARAGSALSAALAAGLRGAQARRRLLAGTLAVITLAGAGVWGVRYALALRAGTAREQAALVKLAPAEPVAPIATDPPAPVDPILTPFDPAPTAGKEIDPLAVVLPNLAPQIAAIATPGTSEGVPDAPAPEPTPAIAPDPGPAQAEQPMLPARAAIELPPPKPQTPRPGTSATAKDPTPIPTPPPAPVTEPESPEALRAQYEQGSKLLTSATPAERAQGMELLESAARGGWLSAQEKLGRIFATGGPGGIQPDDSRALLWYRKAAQQPRSSVRYALARRLELGRWTEEEPAPVQPQRSLTCKFTGARCPPKVLPKPPVQPLDPEADFLAWLRSQSPSQGSEAELQEAVVLYRGLAREKVAEAQERVGYMMLAGHKPGSRFDGFLWLRMAAAQDRVVAQYAIGKLYLSDYASKIDAKAAQCWLRKAAVRSEEARQALQKLGVLKPGERSDSPPKTCQFPPNEQPGE